MVFHVTNYMRETNVWMIRKMRWIFWSFGLSVPIYRNTYWDYLGRRAAWRDSLSFKTEDEKRQEAEALRADWGFHPRYEPKHDFSIKARKYAQQTPEEAINDIPRVIQNEKKDHQAGVLTPTEVHSLVMVLREHNRQPGVFDYNVPQPFYSSFPEIEQECVIEVGSKYRNNVHKHRIHEQKL